MILTGIGASLQSCRMHLPIMAEDITAVLMCAAIVTLLTVVFVLPNKVSRDTEE